MLPLIISFLAGIVCTAIYQRRQQPQQPPDHGRMEDWSDGDPALIAKPRYRIGPVGETALTLPAPAARLNRPITATAAPRIAANRL
jgi:hypothetical protein